MNVAARALAQNSLTWEQQGQHWRYKLSLRTMGIVFLMLSILASALSVVYIKALQRSLYSELQSSQQKYNELQTNWSQLLLEKNMWAAPLRIQVLAQKKLGMKLPHTKVTVLITKTS